MNLTQRLLSFTLVGSEWVLWLLLVLSVLSVTVMVERAIYLRTPAIDFERLARQVLELLVKGDVDGARAALAPDGKAVPETRIARAGLAEFARGADAVTEAMAGAKSRERLELERNLGILGTLGNNAPFIGLFGTVLGIIKAFRDLSLTQGAGSGGNAAVVMAGISEALVATAVGLLVAIPAVVAYNVLQARVRRTLGRADGLAHAILSAVKGSGSAGGPIRAPAGEA